MISNLSPQKQALLTKGMKAWEPVALQIIAEQKRKAL
jgi:hypothetical protein